MLTFQPTVYWFRISTKSDLDKIDFGFGTSGEGVYPPPHPRVLMRRRRGFTHPADAASLG